MSNRSVIVLGALILGGATQIVSLWTVQIVVVPTIIVLVLLALLFLGATPADERVLELPEQLSQRRRRGDEEEDRRRSPRSAA
jgi:hypothetical protein